VSKQSSSELAPASRSKSRVRGPYKKHKLKYAPRGRAFPVGHTFGIDTRFKKGQRANPSGRPSFAEGSKAAKAWLAAVVPGDPRKRTGAELSIEVLGAMALSGDRSAIKEMMDRAEGTPAQSILVNEGQDNLPLLLEGMARIHADRYPAGTGDDDEPQVTPQLESGDADEQAGQ
jgi:hypothetical protein